ncbi:MAG: hypothetical protein U9R48_03205 [Chloroflexota bacterium]|nr:hypothetical protein [Chloroflexota bacterium]
MVHTHLGQRGMREGKIAAGEVEATCYRLHDTGCFTSLSPSIERTFQFEKGIRLLGYDLPQKELTPGDNISLRLYWEGDGPTEQSYHVFVHALGPDGRIYGQGDAVPQEGAMPTTRWWAGELVLDDHRIPIAEDAPPGRYTIALGLYDLETMQRLSVVGATGKAMPQDCALIEGVRIVPGD